MKKIFLTLTVVFSASYISAPIELNLEAKRDLAIIQALHPELFALNHVKLVKYEAHMVGGCTVPVGVHFNPEIMNSLSSDNRQALILHAAQTCSITHKI